MASWCRAKTLLKSSFLEARSGWHGGDLRMVGPLAFPSTTLAAERAVPTVQPSSWGPHHRNRAPSRFSSPAPGARAAVVEGQDGERRNLWSSCRDVVVDRGARTAQGGSMAWDQKRGLSL